MTPPDAREVVVTSVDDTSVMLEFDDQKIAWPKKYAPKNVVVGDRLVLSLMDLATHQAKRETLAKSILNDILQDNEHPEA